MKVTHTFFWKVNEFNGYLSQWYKSSFTINDIEYNCAEQYMMHQKALLFSDEKIANEIMLEKDPQKQKALGRLVKNFNVAIWDSNCESIVYQGNLAKFEQNPMLADKLKSTNDSIIVEASPVDFVWGIGMAIDNKNILNQDKWLGKNLLGKALMLVRLKMFNQ